MKMMEADAMKNKSEVATLTQQLAELQKKYYEQKRKEQLQK